MLLEAYEYSEMNIYLPVYSTVTNTRTFLTNYFDHLLTPVKDLKQ